MKDVACAPTAFRRPVEAAGTVENAPCPLTPRVFHRPLDGAYGADHSSRRPDGGEKDGDQETPE